MFGFLCEMLPTAEQADSLDLKGNEDYLIKFSVNPSLISFEADGQLKKKRKVNGIEVSAAGSSWKILEKL